MAYAKTVAYPGGNAFAPEAFVGSFIHPIQFGSYLFPASTILAADESPSTLDDKKFALHHGGNIPRAWAPGKTIKVKTTIGGSGNVNQAGNLIATRQDVYDEINLLAQQLESGYHALYYAPDRFMVAQKAKFLASPVEATGQTVWDLELEFYSPERRALAYTPTVASTTSPGGGGLGGGVLMTATALVTGERSWPIVTFVNDGDGIAHDFLASPFIQVLPAGSTGSNFILLTTNWIASAPGDTLVIDCDPRNRENAVLLNGVPMMHLLDTIHSVNQDEGPDFFPFFEMGANAYGTGAVDTVVPSYHSYYHCSVSFRDSFAI